MLKSDPPEGPERQDVTILFPLAALRADARFTASHIALPVAK
jgi:hypothetical protein